MARKLVITATARTLLEACVKRGLPITQACRLAGVGRRTYYDWMRRGDAGEKPFAEFAAAMLEAQAEGRDDLLKLVHVHAKSDPATARYLLACSDPAAFGSEGKQADLLEEAEGDATEEEIIQLMAGNADVRAAVLALVAKEKRSKKLGKGKGA